MAIQLGEQQAVLDSLAADLSAAKVRCHRHKVTVDRHQSAHSRECYCSKPE